MGRPGRLRRSDRHDINQFLKETGQGKRGGWNMYGKKCYSMGRG